MVSLDTAFTDRLTQVIYSCIWAIEAFERLLVDEWLLQRAVRQIILDAFGKHLDPVLTLSDIPKNPVFTHQIVLKDA